MLENVPSFCPDFAADRVDLLNTCSGSCAGVGAGTGAGAGAGTGAGAGAESSDFIGFDVA